MRRPLSLFVLLVPLFFLSGCILSASPQSSSISILPGEKLTFYVQSYPSPSNLEWFLDEESIYGATGAFYTYLPAIEDEGEHIIRVVERSTLFGSDSRNWIINVLPINFGDSQFIIHTDFDTHNNYGLGYPVTYKFSIPDGISEIEVYEKKELSSSWAKLDEKTSYDFFNGIDAVRFDYLNNYAYVSIAFGPDSDNIYLIFNDSMGDTISGISYIETSEYYDERKAVITATQDDWNEGGVGNNTCIVSSNKFQSRSIWFSAGITTGNITSHTWGIIQGEINEGFVEPISHSKFHTELPYLTYDNEIGDSAKAIKNNLTPPLFNVRNSEKFVYAWMEPYGQSDSFVRAKLGEYKYIADRKSMPDHVSDDSWATWDNENGLYNRVGYSCRMGTNGWQILSNLNAKFDQVYADGGIYHLSFHPWAIDENAWEAYGDNHLDHIKEKNDVWYVAFGHLYLYHFTQERGMVSVQKNDN